MELGVGFEEVLADGAAAGGDGSEGEVGGLAQPLEELEFEGGDVEGMWGVSAGGMEELLEDFEQAGEGGVGFCDAFEEAGSVGGLGERGVALAEAGEGFFQRDFFQSVQSSLAAWGVGDAGDEVEVEASAEGRLGSGGPAGECGDAALIPG